VNSCPLGTGPDSAQVGEELRASYGAESKYRRSRRRTSLVAEHDDKIIECYTCGSMGHYTCKCRNSNSEWIHKQGGSSQARGSVPRGQASRQPGSVRA
jgi:hypothetical protein